MIAVITTVRQKKQHKSQCCVRNCGHAMSMRGTNGWLERSRHANVNFQPPPPQWAPFGAPRPKGPPNDGGADPEANMWTHPVRTNSRQTRAAKAIDVSICAFQSSAIEL